MDIRRIRRLGRGLLPLALLLVALPSTGAYSFYPTVEYTRADARDENYLIGALTWNAGKGGISWSPDAESETSAGPASDQTADTLQYVNAAADGRLGPNPAAVEFVSQPMPFDVYLNASRLIQLDLWLIAGSGLSSTDVCTSAGWVDYRSPGSPEVQILLDQQVVAGSTETQATQFATFETYYPQDPAGFDICRYKMPTELEFIPAGASLRLVISPHADVYRHYRYGVDPEGGSVLRLPYYPADEAIFRFTEATNLVGSIEEEQEPVDSTGLAGPALLSVGGLGLFALRRSGRRGISCLLVALVLVSGLAGCLGGGKGSGKDGDPDASGSATATLQPANGSGLASGGMGAVVGLVHDDLHIPLGSAHVSLLGTSNATSTDSRGRFQLKNVAPGTHTIRVDRDSFRSLESPISVVSGSITRVDVLLFPLDAKEAGLRPHAHDYWDSESTTLFEDRLGQVCGSSTCGPRLDFRIPATAPGQLPNTVRPGTRLVEVTVNWDPAAMGIRRIGLGVVSNVDRNASFYYARESPATFNVVTNWEMSDAGHQLVSSWHMFVWGVSRDQSSVLDPQYYTDYAKQYSGPAPEFSVKVQIHKGVIPLERAHPDFWGAGPVREVSEDRMAGSSSATVLIVPCHFQFQSSVGTTRWMVMNWAPASIIPPGTKWVEVRLKLSRPLGINGVGAYEWNLAYQTATNQWTPYNFPMLDREEPSNPSYTMAPAAEVSEQNSRFVWRFAVPDEQTDPYYKTSSGFLFAGFPADPIAACNETQAFATANPTATTVLGFNWKIEAHNETMP